MGELIDDLIARLREEYGAGDTKDLVCKMDQKIQQARSDVYEAYQTWPKDLKAKLSFYDLSRMNGWSPRNRRGSEDQS